MSRLALAFAAGFATLVTAGTAAAADYPDPFGSGTDLRSGFGDSADNSDTNDPIKMELGLRYWYSWGAQSFSVNSGLTGDHGTMNESDQSQMVEGHFRVDDNSTKTYVKGIGGMSFKIGGTSTDSAGGIAVSDGHIGYAGADIGYSWLGDGKNTSFGPFAGYMYWNDSPNTYHDNYTTAASASDISFNPVNGQTSFGGDSKPNNIELNMLRLGFSGKAQLGQYFDISGEVAAVPYAKVAGILGAGSGFATGGNVSYDNQSSAGPHGLTGAFNIHDIQSSPTNIDGWGYGGMAELMLGVHPTDNLTFRFGGRAWYVQGTVDATFSRAVIGDPTDKVQPVAGTPADPSTTPPTPATPDQLNPPNFDTPPTFSNQNYISRANPFSVFRYGILAEMTYSF